MSGKKIITVFGATGNQGGGVIDWVLENGTFAVRGVTRNKNSDKSKELAARGVEVVEANLDDVKSLEKALAGSYGAFGVTDFWSVGPHETIQGKNLVDAAKAAGIKHFVWSTLDHTDQLPHFESKALVDDYLKASGVPRTSLYTCAYTDNALGPMFGWKKDPENEGGILFANPMMWTDGAMPAWYSKDTGAWALAAFLKPEKWLNKDISVVQAYLSPRDWAAALSRVTGAPVRIQEVTYEDFLQRRPEGQMEELWKTFKYYYDTKALRGKPEDSIAILEEIGVKPRSVDDVFRIGGGWKVVQG